MSIPGQNVLLQSVQIGYEKTVFVAQDIVRIQFIMGKPFSSSLLRPGKEFLNTAVFQIIKFISCCEKQNQEGDPSLTLKFAHEIHLMGMDVCQGKGIGVALFGIEADRETLHCSDIVHGAFFLKISQRNVAVFFIDLDGGDGGITMCRMMRGS